VRDYEKGKPRGGTLIVQGTSSMVGIVKILPELAARGLNVRIVCGSSPELFARQPETYRERMLAAGDRADSTVVSTQALVSMGDWIFNEVSRDYAMTSDWDNRWRTGGTVDEVLDEAHLSPKWLLEGIERFVRERPDRLARIRGGAEAALG
jgi:transketolase